MLQFTASILGSGGKLAVRMKSILGRANSQIGCYLLFEKKAC